ncbi:hypothetical protein [Acidomonas methanolica]|uniref:Uncharacterized protein n=1 Tax=Acidomonas methanolica NBRC 104435 TaxID=1231351 RepID=A0A023D0F9_ACIMT|nr:hypothetical protein [Acidomonas methanolica]MBU2653295.1 hypothetical protein [Acidomonas methanolica]TCS32244.1 hypothetical protein EDC31_101181 [Acidomonas methanolica]GAJ27617.1 hypothetical protein Amme_005_005 [Acidomonas methanolica NBRC 104435]GBQ54427.1 hypothetical protein AA0498_2113 [Acidomonas methanolica]GEK97679.1 hypothetical protein AME01nite_01780 [Acidomonas methanolica NBRC 104435]
MLAIETWPDPSRGNAPRVRAAADPAILLDLAETALDMLVWGRRVPLVWQEELERCDPLPCDGFSLEGTLDAVTAGLRDAARTLHYPAFLMEDVEQTVALVAALAFSNRLSLCVRSVPPEGMELPGDVTALRLACCYGGVLDWVSGRALHAAWRARERIDGRRRLKPGRLTTALRCPPVFSRAGRPARPA